MGTARLGRLCLGLLASVIVATGVVACGDDDDSGSAASDGSSSQELTTVKTTYMNILALAPLFAGEEAGIFEKNGIKNEYENVNLYEALPLIAQGRQDVGIMAASAAFYNAINQGQQVVAVADRLTYDCSSDNKLVVRKELFDQGVKTYKDLEGKTLAILGEGTATQYWNDKLADENGMSADSFKSIKELGYPETLTALETGGVDAGYLAEPLLSQAIEKGVAEPIIPMYEVVPGDDVGFMIYSKKFADENPETAQAWMKSWLESVRYYLDPANKDAVVAAVSKWTEIPEESLAAMYGTDSWPWMNPNGAVNVDGPERAMDWMLERKFIETAPETSAWYDEQFVTSAVEELGESDSDACASR